MGRFFSYKNLLKAFKINSLAHGLDYTGIAQTHATNNVRTIQNAPAIIRLFKG